MVVSSWSDARGCGGSEGRCRPGSGPAEQVGREGRSHPDVWYATGDRRVSALDDGSKGQSWTRSE